MARGVSIRGKRHKYLVLKVLDRDASGRPKTVECLYDEDSTRIEGGEHFWVVLAPSDMCARSRSLH